MNIKNWILHPILFSIYPVIFSYSNNIGKVTFQNVLELLIFTVLFVFFGWGILRLILNDWFRSGGIASLLIILFYSYGHARTNIDLAGIDYFLPVIWIAALLLGVFVIIRSRTKFYNGTKILNVVSVVLVILVATNIGLYQFKITTLAQTVPQLERIPKNLIDEDEQQPQLERIPKNLIDKDEQQPHPDVYFIILDAYARKDVLKNIYSFDNSKFLDNLESKGFYIADKAIANYGQTGLSLGSSLNLMYLDDLVEQIGENNLNREPLNLLINQNQIAFFLRKKGYKIIALASTRPETQMTSADVFLSSGTMLNEFHEGLKNSTPLPDMESSDKREEVFSRYRMHTMFTLDKLGKLALEHKGPKFIFAHIEQPHPPFVFGPNGEPVQLESRFNDHDGDWLVRPGRLTVEQYHKHYVDQLIFLNKKIEFVIDEILKKSSQPPIVIIFGDHGPRSRLNWQSLEKTDVRESFSILSAYHLPGNGKELLYPEISPVNSIRVIFNHYFGVNLDLLPDRSFYSTARFLYKFQDVTERVRTPFKE